MDGVNNWSVSGARATSLALGLAVLNANLTARAQPGPLSESTGNYPMAAPATAPASAPAQSPAQAVAPAAPLVPLAPQRPQLLPGPPRPPLPAEPAPVVRDWNVGAGVGLFGGGGLGVGGSALSLVQLRTSLERRLGKSTWLLLDGAYGRSVRDVLVGNSDDPDASRTTTLAENSAGIMLGVRQVLTTELVKLSVHVGVQAGSDWREKPELLPNESLQSPLFGTSDSKLFGVGAGLALERELIEALSLRVAMDVASATWTTSTWSDQTTDGPRETELHRRGFALDLAPSLELRLYF